MKVFVACCRWKFQYWKCFLAGTLICSGNKDLQGRAACARPAREDGVHVMQALCVRCFGNDVEANSCYKDALERHACARNAREDGTHVKIWLILFLKLLRWSHTIGVLFIFISTAFSPVPFSTKFKSMATHTHTLRIYLIPCCCCAVVLTLRQRNTHSPHT